MSIYKATSRGPTTGGPRQEDQQQGATTRGPTTGGATTLEDELVWLDRIKRGRVQRFYIAI